MRVDPARLCLLAAAVARVRSTYARLSQREGGNFPLSRDVRSRRLAGANVVTIGPQAAAATATPPDITCSDDPIEITFSDRLYVKHLNNGGGGCVTLTDIYQARLGGTGASLGPLYILNALDEVVNAPGQAVTGRWLLKSDMFVQDGITLLVWGGAIGGDADVLRIESTSTSYFNLRGYGGNLSLYYTIVTSWDTAEGGPRIAYAGGRSYVSCVSEILQGQTCTGKAQKDMGECRMDVMNSEIGYLGWPDSESYGLTWKVRGFCVNGSNPELFDDVNVYGDMKNSDIHDNYFGLYTYGHQGGVWTNNLMHDNHQYGFDPHDDSDNLLIAYNTVYNNGNHGIIASKRCNNAVIRNNEVYGGKQVGIFLHRSSDFGKVYDNYVHDNLDAGMALHESMDSEIYDNVFERNGMGIRISVGGSRNSVHHNIFDNCTQYGLVTYNGADNAWVSNGRPTGNAIFDNQILNTAVAIRLRDADESDIYDNLFTGTSFIRFQDAYDTRLANNTFPTGTCSKLVDSTFTDDSALPPSCY